jgi:hypothetical protein
MISTEMFNRLISSGGPMPKHLGLGLWLDEENCMISLMLQQVVFKKRGNSGRNKIGNVNVSHENFGHVLLYALRDLRGVLALVP